jgi:calcineurin-like phosphoesterase family protein
MLYLTSDLHFNHANIIKYCDRFFCLTDFEKDTLQGIKSRCDDDRQALKEFKISQESVDRMDQIIINRINASVQPNDTLYMLGDLGFAREIRTVRQYIDRINCKHIHFIRGNHDYLTDREYRTVFEFVGHYKEVKYNKIKFILSHWPMVVWNNSFRGSIMCHGHSHSNLNGWKDEHMPGLPLIDVGFDEWAGPVSFDDVIAEAKRIKKMVEDVKYPDMS